MKAYIFIKIDLPIAALAAARGVLVSVATGKDPENGFQSVLAASHLLHENDHLLMNELLLEGARREFAPHAPSRLSGLFCFEQRADAERAISEWGRSYRKEFLTEVGIEKDAKVIRVDANWFTRAPRDRDGVFPHEQGEEVAWMRRYWAGDPMPGAEPHWETIVEGRMSILNLELRQRALIIIQERWPRSMWWVEIWRAAAAAGSDMGEIVAHLQRSEGRFKLQWWINMEDAENPEVLGRLHIKDRQFQPTDGTFGAVPDLRPYGFDRAETDMPLLVQHGRQAFPSTSE